MTEDRARAWVRERFGVSRETVLDRFAEMLRSESTRQNLISASSFDQLWSRHIVDSAQLVHLADAARQGAWLDVGTGAGMPGLVVATLIDRPTILVEPRAKRADFLLRCVDALGLAHRVQVQAKKIENFRPTNRAAIVSARAVAELSELLASTHHCTDSSTVWLLPKGRNAESEVEGAVVAWQGVFHVKPSITQPGSGIVIASGVAPR